MEKNITQNGTNILKKSEVAQTLENIFANSLLLIDDFKPEYLITENVLIELLRNSLIVKNLLLEQNIEIESFQKILISRIFDNQKNVNHSKKIKTLLSADLTELRNSVLKMEFTIESFSLYMIAYIIIKNDFIRKHLIRKCFEVEIIIYSITKICTKSFLKSVFKKIEYEYIEEIENNYLKLNSMKYNEIIGKHKLLTFILQGIQIENNREIEHNNNYKDTSHLSDKIINLNNKEEENNNNNIIDNLVIRKKELDYILSNIEKKEFANLIIKGDKGVGKTSLLYLLENTILTTENYSKQFKIIKLTNNYLENFMSFQTSNQHKNIIICDNFEDYINRNDISNIYKILEIGNRNNNILIISITTNSFNLFKSNFKLSKFSFLTVKEETDKKMLRNIFNLRANDFSMNMKDDIVMFELIYEISKEKYPNKNFPEKLIRTIDDIFAYSKYNNLKFNIETIRKFEGNKNHFVNSYFTEEQIDNLKNLKTVLNKTIFGQENVIEEVIRKLLISNNQLFRNKEKPIGSFLFSGKTGTGKTELAIQLSKSLNMDLIRFDMSEYFDKHEVARILGSPPGYIGYEEDSKIVKELLKKPNSIILFDEIEKAHPSIMNIFLQILDYGNLTTGNGTEIKFNNNILIFTSNKGQHSSKKVGFTKNIEFDIKEETDIKEFFLPEVLNRFDSVIRFNDLTEEISKKIVIKYLEQLKNKLSLDNTNLEYKEELVEYLIKECFNENFGARNINRYIEKNIISKIAEEMIFSSEKKFNLIEINIDNNNIKINYLNN